MSDFPVAAVFVADALAWSRNQSEMLAVRLLRSPYSGVPHDIGAAYAVVAARFGLLLDSIARERLALPSTDRDAVFAFAQKMNRLHTATEQELDDAGLETLVQDIFLIAKTPSLVEPQTQPDVIDLAEAVDAEPGSGIRVRQQHFSASSLNTYVECPRKWYYRYTCSAVEDRGSSASLYGTAFHAALEDFHAEFTQPSDTLETTMRERIREYVTWAFERFRPDFATAVEFTLQLRRAQRTAQRYVGWLVERWKRAPFTVVGRELPAALQVEGFDFIGFIDRLDRNDATGAVSIMDYKTGTIAASAAEYRDKVRKFLDFQLPFYYWAREAQGDRVATLALIPLKDATLDVAPIELEVVPVPREETRKRNASSYGTIGIAELERARERMGAICRELTAATITHFPVTTDPSACVYCAYATACNDRPPAPEDKFGR